MNAERDAAFRERIAAVRGAVDLIELVGASVKLGRGRNPRGQCPFHGSTSESLSVMAEPRGGGAPFVHCFGCGWHGDAIKFVTDYHGVDFMEALSRLEDENGLAGLAADPVQRKRAPQRRRTPQREVVDSAVMGRWLWDAGRPDMDVVRTYFMGRGIREGSLPDVRLLPSFRFVAVAPIVPWPVDAKPTSVATAPALVALVRRRDETGGVWRPIGVHVTFLAPDLAGKMVRQRGDGSFYPERKMLGEVQGGAVLLGRIVAGEPIYVGEGNETVLSGLELAGAHWKHCGLAALSLDNLSGQPVHTKGGAMPLYDIRPDPSRAPAFTFAHDGPVTGLIDADMKPLRGPIDRQSGMFRGLPVIERRGGPVMMRAISTAERARICGELFVRNWRAAGCRRVSAARPPMGMDFNDLGRAA